MPRVGLTIMVNAGALQRWPPLEVGPPSEVGPPLDVESPLEVALLRLGREEETLEGYFSTMVVRVRQAQGAVVLI